MSEKSQKIYEEYAQKASEEDVEKIYENLNSMKRGPIAKIWKKVTALWELVRDPDAAWGAKAMAIGALLYLISPVDAVPDLIPVVGLLDDVGIISSAVAALAVALSKYDEEEEN